MTTTGCEQSAAQAALDAIMALGRADAEMTIIKQRAKAGNEPSTAATVAAIDHYAAAFAGVRDLARQLVGGGDCDA